ncbi:RAVE protein 1 C terminal-domain-containing protein [Globomyces pollinis-pini]|nr:RAVE protein 1 C terminal-domain-containing protein [Globomyces pollinis-pini]
MLEGSLGAKPNSHDFHYPIVATGTVQETTVIAFATGNNVDIYDGSYNLLQQIAAEDKVNCVAIQPGTNIIAFTSGSKLHFYYLEMNSEIPLFWKQQKIYEHPCEIGSIDWGSNGTLLVAGQTTCILKLKRATINPELLQKSNSSSSVKDGEETDQNLILQQQLQFQLALEKPEFVVTTELSMPFQPVKCQYSPCSKFFAVYGKDNRHVLIWYERQNGDNFQYEFALLPHQLSIINIEWRYPCNSKQHRSAILTLCNDNIARLWAETDQGFGFHTFNLCGSIDPQKQSVGNYESFENNFPVGSIHWLTGRALSTALNLEHQAQSFKKTLDHIPPSKLTDTLHEFPDMLYAIKPNGSMIIWGIQGLGSNPTRVVKIALIMKTDNTVLEVDHSFFNGMVLSFCNRSKESCHNSPEIQFLGQQNEDHVLNSYSMNLDDFFSHDWSSPRLLLVGSWCGPRVPIVEVIRHSVMPYVALLDQANELSIFSASIPKSGLRSTTGLTIVTVLPSGSSCLAFAWIPTAVRCTMAVAYQDQLSIYTLDDVVTYIGTLNNFPTSPISKLMIYPQNKISECNSFYILASTKSGLISLWSVSIDYDKLSVQSTHIGTQSFPENSEFFQTYALDHDSLLNADQIPSLFATFLEDTFSIYHFQNPNIIPVEFQLNDPFINISSFKFTNPKGRIKVKFAIFGKLAIAHHLENDYIIDIWDNEADGLEMTLEYQLKFNSPIVDIDWLTCNDGQHILLVAFPQSVALYIKSHFQFGCIWKEAINIPIEEPQRIISCAWLSHGSLLVSTNVKSAIYSPWVEIAAGIPSHLFEISSVQSGRLSDHDPNLLFNYMLWGKYDLVKYNLSMLHRFTKLSLETSKPFSKIPFPLWKLTSSEESTDTKPVYDDLFSDSNQEDLNALGVFGKTQIDYLLEHLPNSTVANADKLVGFIKAFEKFEEHRKSLDQNGGRYLLTAVYHFYMNTLNLLTARDFTWAFFSDSQEYIIDTMTQMAGGKLLWNDAKNLGFGWWISNGNLLKKTFEVIARNQYWGLHGIHDPVACSLYYLGLKKKNVLVGLWKLASTHPEQAQMMKFLANDFNEDRWKNAALKNAYALLGKQRYEYSAAFFLLADRLKDAVNVCVKNLNDPQLAISLCRVYEGENGPVLLETLKSQLIPNACQAGDRWVSCILWTYYNNRDNAFYSITRPLQSLLEEPMEIDVSYDTFDPNLLLLYYHLKVAYKSLIMAKVPQLTSAEETHLLINCAQSYDRLGCPGLALELIVQNKLDQLPELEIIDEKKSSEEDNAAEASNSQTAEGIDWGEPVSTSQSGGIDWGEPVSKDSGGIDWGEPVTKTSGGIDWGESESKVTSEGIDWGEPEKPAASGGLDWGDMTTTITNTGLDFDELDTTFPTEVEDIQVEQHVPTHQEILKVSKFELLRLNVRLINMNVYKGILTRRILHAIHHSLEMISDYKEELKGDAILSDYTGNLRKGIISLANLSNMTVNQVGILIMKRCQEMFSFNAFVELLPFEANNMAPFVIPTQQMIINQTNILCYITFQNDLERQSKEKHHLVDLLSKNILIGWVAWYKKSYTFGTKTSEVVMTQAVVAGYMIQVVTAALFKRRNRLWWMLGLCEQFFDTLLKSDGKGLCNLIEDALAEREPIVCI